MAAGRPHTDSASPPVPGLRWRRVFPGEERELTVMRQWLSSLLPPCPARHDVLSVATELGSNAIRHTASRGTWFAVEITWHPSVVHVAVADCGGPGEPHPINDPDAEHGRGLLMVRGLSLRSGYTGDQRGRLVWAQIDWHDPHCLARGAADDPYQAAVRDGEEALARKFAGVPSWFGRSTLDWWALAGPAGLVSAPTAPELANRLQQLLATPVPPEPATALRAQHGRAAQPAPLPGTTGTRQSRPRRLGGARDRRWAVASGLGAAGTAPAGA